MIEQLLGLPGFLYEVDGHFYYLGKWICRECSDTEASDCAIMYQMCRSRQEEPETNLYFQKLRAFSDFALEVPYNPWKIQEDMSALIDRLSDHECDALRTQLAHFKEDLQKYCST